MDDANANDICPNNKADIMTKYEQMAPSSSPPFDSDSDNFQTTLTKHDWLKKISENDNDALVAIYAMDSFTLMIDVGNGDEISNGCDGLKIKIDGFDSGSAQFYSCSITDPDPNNTDLTTSLIGGEWYVVAAYDTDQSDMKEDIQVSCQKGSNSPILTDSGTVEVTKKFVNPALLSP